MRKVCPVALFLTLFFLSSCNDPFEETIRKVARDGEITLTEWNEIEKSVLDSRKSRELLNSDGSLNNEKTKDYVENFVGKNMRINGLLVFPNIGVEKEILMEEDTVTFKFFLERSGSMTPYDDVRTDGGFKKAISMLLNSIPGNGTQRHLMYVVNDAVYTYNRTYKDFLQSANIFTETQSIGDPRYTDFTCIFDSILNRTGENEASILVSDLIYSTKNMAGVNPQRILNEAQTLTTSVFKGHSDRDVLVIKLLSDYVGNYYPYNSPNIGKKYNGKRPFYLMIVANPDVMKKIFFDEKYKDFRNFKHLNGFENYYCFVRKNDKPLYSVIFSDGHVQGRFAAAKGSTQTIHSIEDLEPDRHNNVTTLVVAVDMNEIITEKDYLTDANNYEIQSASGFELKEIIELNTSELDPSVSRYVPTATHLLVLSTEEKLSNETLILRLKNKFPVWIEKSSSDDDTNFENDSFAGTTFAFKYLMQGIYDSFYSSASVPDYYQINIDIKKK